MLRKKLNKIYCLYFSIKRIYFNVFMFFEIVAHYVDVLIKRNLLFVENYVKSCFLRGMFWVVSLIIFVNNKFKVLP